MKIREAAIGDIDILTGMNIRLRADEKMDNFMTDAQVKERMAGFLGPGSACKAYLFYEETTDEIDGYALVDFGKKPAYLRQLYIERDRRSKGLGAEDFRLLLVHTGLTEIDIEVMEWNERAQKFYKNLGFYPRYVGMRYKKDGSQDQFDFKPQIKE